MQILISTSDKTINALKGFAYFWQLYSGTLSNYPIDVCGYTHPTFELPKNFHFASLGKFEDYPAQRWSDGLGLALDTSDDPNVLVLMDDYWLLRNIDVHAIELFDCHMTQDKSILRFDLSSDRLYAEGAIDVYALSHYDIIETDHSVPYGISLQASLWNRELLRHILIPNESAWALEMVGNERLKLHPDYRILGTRQVPMKYLIAVQAGKLTLDSGYQSPRLDYLLEKNKKHFEEIKSLGYLEGL